MSLSKFNIENQIHFITINTLNKLNLFTDTKCCAVFIKVLDELRHELKFKLLGFVIMLNHVHLLIQLWVGSNSFEPSKESEANKFASTQSENTPTHLGVGSNSFEPKPEANEFASTPSNISYVVKRIKGASAREINKKLKRKGSFWQKDFYDFNIYSVKKLEEKLNYIYDNPVRAGLVKNPEDWKYSSFRDYYLDDESLIKIDRIDI